jgi:spore coat protein JC
MGYVNQESDPDKMLKADVDLEIRSRLLFEKHLSLTSDSGVKRVLAFLARREGVHQSLLKRARKTLADGGASEQYLEIIYDYKMSLQVLD